MDRHGRQARLAEVGREGQARIASARVEIRSRGPAASIAARYLAGAGVGHLRTPDETAAAAARAVDPGVHVEVGALPRPMAPAVSPFALRNPSADAVALGAHEALVAIRRALGVGA
jgi:hypothetical protein